MIHLGHVLCENPGTVLSFKLFAVFALRALIDRWLVPYDPLTTTSLRALEAQSGDRWFGTDRLGRDVFSRTIMAARLDPTISMLKVGISVIISSILGALAGYWGGWLDAVLDRILDTILAFPLFVPAMGSSLPLATRWKIIYAAAIINITLHTRVVRAGAIIEWPKTTPPARTAKKPKVLVSPSGFLHNLAAQHQGRKT